jgi:hypothetical protein
MAERAQVCFLAPSGHYANMGAGIGESCLGTVFLVHSNQGVGSLPVPRLVIAEGMYILMMYNPHPSAIIC